MSYGKILIADDEEYIARLLRAYLETDGYSVLVAADAETALNTIRRERPDLVLLELMLPGLDGWGMLRTIRADPSTAGLAIIVLSVCGRDDDKVAALELGADDYITKPFTRRELVARVHALLRRRLRSESCGAFMPTARKW